MQIFKNSFIYLASSIISKGTPFILLPFLTSYLSPSEFGMQSVFLVISAVYSALVGMAIHTNVAKNFFKSSQYEISVIIGNVFLILLMVSVLYVLLTFILTLFLNEAFSIPSNYLLLLPVIAFFSMSYQVYLCVLRSEGRAYIFGFFEIANAIISMIATLVFLTYLEFGWLSQILGMSLSSIILSAIGVIYLYRKKYLTLIFDKIKALSILRLSIPLIPHVLGGVVISLSDRLFIEKMIDLETVAIYSIGYSFGMVVSLFVDALIKAWGPWFYKQLAKPSHEKKVKIVKLTYAYFIGLSVILIVISFSSQIILPYVVEGNYHNASQYIFWIALGYAVQGVYKIFHPYLVHISKTKFLALSTALAATTNLLLNYILIQYFGALGAAYATIIAFLISAIFVFECQRRNYSMPWFSLK